MSRPYHALFAETQNLVNEVETFMRNWEGSVVIGRLVRGSAYIRVSGFIELAHESILGDFAARTGPASTARYVERTVGSLTNLNATKVIALWGRFSSDWQQTLSDHEEMETLGRWKAAFDGVLNVRNSQAHGGNQLASAASLKQYFQSVSEYFTFVRATFLP